MEAQARAVEASDRKLDALLKTLRQRDRGEHRLGFVDGLVEFLLRVAVGDDAAAGLDVGEAILDSEIVSEHFQFFAQG